MARHPFPGYRPFLEAAASAAGVALDVVDQARHLKPIDRVSTLLGQAVEHVDDKAVAQVVAEAEKVHAVLAIAATASAAMIADVRKGLGLDAPPKPAPAPSPAPAPKAAK